MPLATSCARSLFVQYAASAPIRSYPPTLSIAFRAWSRMPIVMPALCHDSTYMGSCRCYSPPSST